MSADHFKDRVAQTGTCLLIAACLIGPPALLAGIGAALGLSGFLPWSILLFALWVAGMIAGSFINEWLREMGGGR